MTAVEIDNVPALDPLGACAVVIAEEMSFLQRKTPSTTTSLALWRRIAAQSDQSDELSGMDS